MISLESDSISERMLAAVKLSWSAFSRKVGNGLIPINKEASMQLHYAYILQQILPIIVHHQNEKFTIELESGVNVMGRSRSIDLLFKGNFQDQHHSIAIEMKCYRTLAASGGARGATDIFMKDVYEDFFLLEQYQVSGIANQGIALVMNDLQRLVTPKNKSAKCWDYDISDGASFGPVSLTTPIGGKPVNLLLEKSYTLSWVKYGNFWFMEVQGKL